MLYTTQLSNAEHALREDDLQGNSPDPASAGEAILPRLSSDSAVLSFQQEQLLVFAQLRPNLPVLNESFTMKFTAALNVSVLIKLELDSSHLSTKNSYS
jgi:hypothetical protein